MKIVTLFLALFLAVPSVKATTNFESYHWKELECLAKNLYYEARGEGFRGMMAVGTVTMNRVESGKFPNTVCAVVYEKTFNKGKRTCQFSWVCQPNVINSKKNLDLYREAVAIAARILYTGDRLHKVSNALFFHADYVNPRWRNMRHVATIGRHIFYEPRS
jgi:spore germination cell wall hydrolase CwlJ-like protein